MNKNFEKITPEGDLLNNQHSEDIHIVLVEPINSLNIGAVMRSMANLGFKHLHLVDARDWDPKRAEITACHGAHILKSTKFYDHLNEALASMQEVVGLSARVGKNRPRHSLLNEWCSAFSSGPKKQTALVFGPEETGLRQEHIEHCTQLIRIPSATECPSFNLAQAVLLVLFTLNQQSLSNTTMPARSDLPEWNDFYQLERIVEEVLSRSGFYRKGTPATMPGRVKNILRRLNPDEREMELLLGMFGRINRTLAGDSPIYPLSEDN